MTHPQVSQDVTISPVMTEKEMAKILIAEDDRISQKLAVKSSRNSGTPPLSALMANMRTKL